MNSFFDRAKTIGVDLASRSNAAAQRTVKQSERTKIAKLDLPRAFAALGKAIYLVGTYRESFAYLHQEIDKLKSEVAAIESQAASRPKAEGMADKAKSVASAAKFMVQIKALQHQVSQDFTALGKAAYELRGDASGPEELVQRISACKIRIAALDAEITSLSSSQSKSVDSANGKSIDARSAQSPSKLSFKGADWSLAVIVATIVSLTLSILQRVFYGSWMTLYSLLASTLILSWPILLWGKRHEQEPSNQETRADWKLGGPIGAAIGFLYGLLFGGVISNVFYGAFVGAGIVGAIKLRNQVPSIKPAAAWIGGAFVVLHILGFLTPGRTPSADQQTAAEVVPGNSESASNGQASGSISPTPQLVSNAHSATSPDGQPNSTFVIDAQGNTLFNVDCDPVGAGKPAVRGFRNGMAAVKKGGKWGFINRTGKLVIPCVYAEVGDFEEEVAAAKDASSAKYGFITIAGKTAIPFMFDDVNSETLFGPPGCFSEGKAAIRQGNSYGFIDKTGKLVISADYEYASPFVDNRSTVWVRLVSGKVKSGIIDEHGSYVMEPRDGLLEGFADGIAMTVGKAERVQFVDLNGKVIVPWSFGVPFGDGGPDVTGFSCGRAAGGGGGDFLNLPDDAPVSEANRRMAKMTQTGFIDKSGNLVIDIQFDAVKRFSDDRAVVRPERNGKWGVIDTDGKWIVEPTYDDAKRYSEGLAAARSNDKWGFIDTSGKVVISPRFSAAGVFHEGMAVIEAGEPSTLVKSGAEKKQALPTTDKSSAPTGERNKLSIPQISSKELFNEMKNEFAGLKKFGKEPIVVYGYVISVEEEFVPLPLETMFGPKKQWCIRLGCYENAGGFTSWIECYCDDAKTAGLEKISPGFTAHIQGTVYRTQAGIAVQMIKCRCVD
jgi:hypothetical protein